MLRQQALRLIVIPKLVRLGGMNKKNNPAVDNAVDMAGIPPDEPMFILLGRDPQAADLVQLWAEGRDFLQGSDDPKVPDARRCADAMANWCVCRAGGKPVAALTLLPFEMLAGELRRRGAVVLPGSSYGGDTSEMDDLDL